MIFDLPLSRAIAAKVFVSRGRALAKRIMAALVSASLVVVSPPALAQTPAPPRDGATSVRDLPVVSTRTVTTRDPRSATCEQLIDKDPQFRALVGIAAKGGDAYFELRLPGMPNLPVPKSAPSALFLSASASSSAFRKADLSPVIA